MTLLETIRHFVREADDSLGAASGMYDGGFYRSAIHEAYYAMFYIATAALGTRELHFKRHATVISQFNRIFVNDEELFPKDLASLFSVTEDMRLKFDYHVEGANEGDAELAIKNAEAFVRSVRPYVHKWLETAVDKEA